MPKLSTSPSAPSHLTIPGVAIMHIDAHTNANIIEHIYR